MNKKIYSLVWNKSLGQIVVASELAVCKSAGGNSAAGRAVSQWARLAMAVLLAMGAMPSALAGQAFCPGGTAPGKGALACGKGSIASGAYATAIGTKAVASGDYASAFGYNAQALGNFAIAIGVSSIATGTGSIAAGNYSNAYGPGDIALGQNARANGVGYYGTAPATAVAPMRSRRIRAHRHSAIRQARQASTPRPSDRRRTRAEPAASLWATRPAPAANTVRRRATAPRRAAISAPRTAILRSPSGSTARR